MEKLAKPKDIFISYRREDGYLFAQLLADSLTQKGYSVFYDRKDLVVGSVFPEELTQAVTSCQEFIAVVTPMYLGAQKNGIRRITQADDWVHKEILFALEQNKNVLPLIIDCQLQENDLQLPSDISSFTDHNFIYYDKNTTIPEFVSALEKGFCDTTIKNSKYNSLIQDLYEISDESDNDFNIKIRNLILAHNQDVVENKLIPLIKNREETEDLCFAAFYACFTYYRRLGYAYKIHDLVNQFGAQFATYRFNNVVLSQHYSLLFELDGNKAEDLLLAVKYAQIALELIPQNSGVMQNYADLITKSFELGFNHNQQQLELAIFKIQDALTIKPDYPKYHCTLGRLLSFKKKYTEAVASIQRAINLENMETKDSFIRTTEYNKYITEVKLRHLENKMNHRLICILFSLLSLWIISIIFILS